MSITTTTTGSATPHPPCLKLCVMIQRQKPTRTTLNLNALCTILHSDMNQNQFKILLIRYLKNGGERGIRTPGTFRYNGFQDHRNRPLCHLSDRRLSNRYWGDLACQYCVSLMYIKWVLLMHAKTSRIKRTTYLRAPPFMAGSRESYD